MNNLASPLIAVAEVEVLVDRVVPRHLGDKEANTAHGILRGKIGYEFAHALLFTGLKPAYVVLQNVAQSVQSSRPVRVAVAAVGLIVPPSYCVAAPKIDPFRLPTLIPA
jgi:hypothetical protein